MIVSTPTLSATDAVALQVLDSLDRLCEAVIADIRRHVPELDHVEPAALASLRRALEQSYGELCSLLRSGFPVAATPPVGAFDTATELNEAGLGRAAAESAIRCSLTLFRRVARALGGDGALADLDAVVSDYWAGYATAVSDGYQGARTHEPEPLRLQEPLPDPPGTPAIDAYIAARSVDPGLAGLASRVRARSEAIIEEFCEALETACAEPRIAAKLAGAGTSVAIVLADEDDVCATLLLDREPIEISRGTALAAETTIGITSADLDRLSSEEFHLAMAMARGRVQWSGPVRKFLRLAPVIQQIVASGGEGSNPAAA